MDIIGKKNLYFLISGLLLVPGLISLLIFGLKFGIDFSGGSRLELTAANSSLSKEEVENTYKKYNAEVHVFNQIDQSTVNIRSNPIDQKVKDSIVADLKKQGENVTEKSFDTVGPTIGQETTWNAITAVIIASLAITAYIAFAFRQVSRPVASWRYGIGAVIALLHDVFIVIGLFSILGALWGVEVDALFITALLTVMGFSVHDTIVVFDRIRENLKKNVNLSYEQVVNNSVLETINRSVNTSVTVVFVLFALLLFGGESIRWFTLALLVGILAGTYSSIFNAAPLLVVWYQWDKKRKNKKR